MRLQIRKSLDDSTVLLTLAAVQFVSAQIFLLSLLAGFLKIH